MIGLAVVHSAWLALERWRAVPDFPAYEVSTYGRVRRAGRVLHPIAKASRAGMYHVLNLFNDEGREQFRLNRLVALTWLERPRRGRDQVDHRDGDTLNNRVVNLEWVSQGENQRRSHAANPRRRDARGRILPRAVAA